MISNAAPRPMVIDSMVLIGQEGTSCSCLVSSLSSVTISYSSLYPKSFLNV